MTVSRVSAARRAARDSSIKPLILVVILSTNVVTDVVTSVDTPDSSLRNKRMLCAPPPSTKAFNHTTGIPSL